MLLQYRCSFCVAGTSLHRTLCNMHRQLWTHSIKKNNNKAATIHHILHLQATRACHCHVIWSWHQLSSGTGHNQYHARGVLAHAQHYSKTAFCVNRRHSLSILGNFPITW